MSGVEAGSAQPSDTAELVETLRHKLWMVACHATGGGIPKIEGIDRPTNDISVQITAHLNRVYRAGKDVALADCARFPTDMQSVERVKAATDAVLRWSAHVERFAYERSGVGMDASPHMLAGAARELIAALNRPDEAPTVDKRGEGQVDVDDALAFADQIAEQHRQRANDAEERIKGALNSLIAPGETWQAYAFRLRAALTPNPEHPHAPASTD